MSNKHYDSKRRTMHQFTNQDQYDTKLIGKNNIETQSSKQIYRSLSSARYDLPQGINGLQIYIPTQFKDSSPSLKTGTTRFTSSHNRYLSQRDNSSDKFKNLRMIRGQKQIVISNPQSPQRSQQSITVTSKMHVQQKSPNKILDTDQEVNYERQKIQEVYVQSFKDNNVENAIKSLSELLISFAYTDNIIGFLKTYRLIAETFIKQNQKTNGLNVMIQLSNLCDILHEVPKVYQEIKPQILLDLSNLAQDFGIYDTAYALIKKALQYGWYYNDVDLELRCFEKLGLISYLNQDVTKATYYHNRSQWGRSESRQSQNYQLTTQNIKCHIMKLRKGVNNIDYKLIGRATFLPFFFSQEPQNNLTNKTVTNKFMLSQNMNVVNQQPRYTTEQTYFQLFEKLMSTEEFYFQMATPREENIFQPNPLNPLETFYHVLKDRADRQEKIYLNNLKCSLKKFQGFVSPTQDNRLGWTYKLQQSLKKKPLQSPINVQTKPDQKKSVSEILASFRQMRVHIKDVVQISHLSTNRDLDQFGNDRSVKKFDPEVMFRKTHF